MNICKVCNMQFQCEDQSLVNKIFRKYDYTKHNQSLIHKIFTPGTNIHRVDTTGINISGDLYSMTQHGEKLGGGTSGTVGTYKLSNGNNSEMITIKRELTDSAERCAYSQLGQKSATCGILRTRPIDDPNLFEAEDYLTFMETMDGSLESLNREIINKNIVTIIESVRTQVVCLFQQSLYYTDIKPGNILYSIDKNGSYKFIVGDIGALCNKSRESTYFPSVPFRVRFLNNDLDHKEYGAYIVWLIGWLYICLIYPGRILSILDPLDRSIVVSDNIKNIYIENIYIEKYMNITTDSQYKLLFSPFEIRESTKLL